MEQSIATALDLNGKKLHFLLKHRKFLSVEGVMFGKFKILLFIFREALINDKKIETDTQSVANDKLYKIQLYNFR